MPFSSPGHVRIAVLISCDLTVCALGMGAGCDRPTQPPRAGVQHPSPIAAGHETQTAAANSASWTEAELSGTFVGYERTEGAGRIYLVIAAGQAGENSGDFRLDIRFRAPAEATFTLRAPHLPEHEFRMADLGALVAPPDVIDTTKLRGQNGGQFRDDGPWRQDANPQNLIIGHYYYLVARDSRLVLQPTSFTVEGRVRTGNTSFILGTEESATCTLKFRYVHSEKGVADLNQVLKAHSASPPQPVLPGRHPEEPRPAGNPEPAAMASDILLRDYEVFQRDSKTFIDSRPPSATVRECDVLLTRATTLDTNIEALLITSGADAKSLEVKAKTIEERLQTSTNLQIRDRMQTLISDLKTQKEQKELQQREWTARRRELLDAKKNLYDYRGVLEVLESK